MSDSRLQVLPKQSPEAIRTSNMPSYSNLSVDDQSFDIIKNLQEELAMERRSVRRLEEQLLKSQQRWNFFFSRYEGMVKSQLDPIFDDVDNILGKLLAAQSSARASKTINTDLKATVENLRQKTELVLSEPKNEIVHAHLEDRSSQTAPIATESTVKEKINPPTTHQAHQIFFGVPEQRQEIQWSPYRTPAPTYGIETDWKLAYAPLLEPSPFAMSVPVIHPQNALEVNKRVQLQRLQHMAHVALLIQREKSAWGDTALVLSQRSLLVNLCLGTKDKVGIGIVLGRFRDRERAGKYFIIDVSPGGAAARSGAVKAGDVLHAVDGAAVRDLDQRSVSAMIVGPSGSAVRLTLGRTDNGAERTYSAVILRDA